MSVTGLLTVDSNAVPVVPANIPDDTKPLASIIKSLCINDSEAMSTIALLIWLNIELYANQGARILSFLSKVFQYSEDTA
ncbi:hypothetical protein DERP_000210 [Dermatophagoides pteronyssinus]|uniref:Uncharacterized protein n=1 Tax=Dermatophagoides pteronyssinus TaxID=6956 RepID=A0ABQ8IZH6_DERPT|nr:hypothetical protein DERP_000210 [Dermatophagoides pteronyssinus]